MTESNPNIREVCRYSCNFRTLHESNHVKYVQGLYNVENIISLDHDITFECSIIMNKYDLPNLIGLAIYFDHDVHKSELADHVLDLLQHRELIEYGRNNMVMIKISKLFWIPQEPIVGRFLKWSPKLKIVFRQCLPSLVSDTRAHLTGNTNSSTPAISNASAISIARKYLDICSRLTAAHQNNATRHDIQNIESEFTTLPPLKDSNGNPLLRTLVRKSCQFVYNDMQEALLRCKLTLAQDADQQRLCRTLSTYRRWPGQHNLHHSLIQYHFSSNEWMTSSDTILQFNATTTMGDTLLTIDTQRYIRYISFSPIRTDGQNPAVGQTGLCVYTDGTSPLHSKIDPYVFKLLQFPIAASSVTPSTKSCAGLGPSALQKRISKESSEPSTNAVSRSRIALQMYKILKTLPYELLDLVMDFYSRSAGRLFIPRYITAGPWYDIKTKVTKFVARSFIQTPFKFENVKGLDTLECDSIVAETRDTAVDNCGHLQNVNNLDLLEIERNDDPIFDLQKRREFQYLNQNDFFNQKRDQYQTDNFHKLSLRHFANREYHDVREKNQYIIQGGIPESGKFTVKLHQPIKSRFKSVHNNDALEKSEARLVHVSMINSKSISFWYAPCSNSHDYVCDGPHFGFPCTINGVQVTSSEDLVRQFFPDNFAEQSWCCSIIPRRWYESDRDSFSFKYKFEFYESKSVAHKP